MSSMKRKRDHDEHGTLKKSKPNMELYAKVDSRTGTLVTNLLEWRRWVQENLITKYPTYFSDAIRANRRVEILSPEQIATELPDIPLKPANLELFIPTAEQERELDGILNARQGTAATREARRARRLIEMRVEWLQEVLNHNAEVTTQNAVQKGLREEKIKEWNSYPNKALELIGDLTDTWSEQVLLRAKSYT